MNNPTVNLFFDTRSQKKDGTYPVKLTLYFNGKKRRYNLNVDLLPSEWDKINNKNLRDENLKKIKQELNGRVEEADQCINQLHNFTFENFEKLFFTDAVDKNNVFDVYKKYIATLTEEGRINTASSYKCSLNSIRSFYKHDNLLFTDITPEFLSSYEKWMLSNNNSSTTVGIYLRCLRTLFNDLIRNSTDKQYMYPFGRGKFQIPLGRNIKKALDISEIEKIYNYPAKEWTNEEKARDLWLFSYLCNGINTVDIANLKYKNIDKERILFIREKTKNSTRKNSKPVVVILSDDVKQIIDKWGDKPSLPDSYVFPLLKDGLTPTQKLAKVKQFTKTINEHMRKISQKIGIDKNITTYTARHSFSTILKRSGAPIEFISESLGHTDLKTTENYLDSFEDHYKKEWASKLTAFKKTKPLST